MIGSPEVAAITGCHNKSYGSHLRPSSFNVLLPADELDDGYHLRYNE